MPLRYDPSTLPGDLPVLLGSFELALRAQNIAEPTIDRYLFGVRKFVCRLHDTIGPLDAADVTREHVRQFLAHELTYTKPSTVKSRHGDLRGFFGFLLEDGEISTDPTAGVKAPEVPPVDNGVVTDETIRALLKGVAGTDFTSRRDAAVLWLFADTPLRKSAVAGISLSDVDLRARTVATVEKGREPVVTAIGDRAALALDRYLRVRARHTHASLPWLWLGPKGPFGGSGIAQMLRRRGRAVGVDRLTPHMFRRRFAAAWLEAGGAEGDLMQLGNWRTRAMMDHYARQAAKQRALTAHGRMRLSDRL